MLPDWQHKRHFIGEPYSQEGRRQARLGVVKKRGCSVRVATSNKK